MISLAVALALQTPTLRDQTLDAYRRAAETVLAQQNEDGSWSRMGYPTLAYTGLYAAALLQAPPEVQDRARPAGERALAWLVSRQNADGSFSEMMESHKTYTTGIVLMALGATDASRERYADAIRRAQTWVRGAQSTDGFYRGGMGYGDIELEMNDGRMESHTEGNPSVSATAYAAEGMRSSGAPADDAFFRMVTEFVGSCQNSSETNANPELVARLREAGYVVADDGGICYAPFPPDENKPSPEVRDDGTRAMRSYGSMTYEGLKTYLYAGLTREDPRVQSAMRWVRSHYRVDGHPGFEYESTPRAESTGLFYYYVSMTRALDAYGERPLTLEDGRTVDWAADLAQEILRRQAADGTWVNENPRWWEDDPMLVTGYMLHALDILVRRLGE